ncbi:MAG: Maf family protein [Alphaproteobacteria bacterium]|nr:Maf family protein [Alphaproteobacteria bacterium]
MTKPMFILASSSPRRLALLKDIGIVPDKIVHADADEAPRPRELPRLLAQRLALAKLQAVSAAEKSAIILAADTVVGCGRRILPKAQTDEDVRRFWRLMSGRRHHVYTGVALRTPQGKILQRLSDSIVTFRRVTEPEIEAYVKSGEGVGKAGGYAIQGRAATHIRFIAGSYSNIVGLPLYEVAQLLRSCGYPL